jgi:hypothetical protein
MAAHDQLEAPPRGVEALTLEWDIGRPHAGDSLCRRIRTSVAPAAEVEAKAPHRLPARRADDTRVLLDDRLRRRAREEVEVEDAAEHAVLDERDIRRRRGQKQNVGAGGRGNEYTV